MPAAQEALKGYGKQRRKGLEIKRWRGFTGI
jgi:hypothetical protein